MSVHADVAKLLRKFLKDNNIKGSVKSQTYSGGNSVNVTLQDVNPEQFDLVYEESKKYQKGSFDPMTDHYELSNLNDNIPQVQYTFVKCDFSDELRQKALDVLHAEFQLEYENVPKNHSELNCDHADLDGDYIFSAIRGVLQNGHLYENLWKKVF